MLLFKFTDHVGRPTHISQWYYILYEVELELFYILPYLARLFCFWWMAEVVSMILQPPHFSNLILCPRNKFLILLPSGVVREEGKVFPESSPTTLYFKDSFALKNPY